MLYMQSDLNLCKPRNAQRVNAILQRSLSNQAREIDPLRAITVHPSVGKHWRNSLCTAAASQLLSGSCYSTAAATHTHTNCHNFRMTTTTNFSVSRTASVARCSGNIPLQCRWRHARCLCRAWAVQTCRPGWLPPTASSPNVVCCPWLEWRHNLFSNGFTLSINISKIFTKSHVLNSSEH